MSDPIVISREEALGPHVDSLLQRQKGLRGQPQHLANRRPPWYLRNWLVLGIAGTVGAILAWAVLEPGFDDFLYIQGRVQDVEPGASPEGPLASEVAVQGLVRIDGAAVWVPFRAQALGPDGTTRPLDISSLSVGDEVGVHLRYASTPREGAGGVGHYFDLAPRPGPRGSAAGLEKRAHRSELVALLIFPLVAGGVGLLIGAADGLVCRLPVRALLAGGVGLLVGVVGGFLASIGAGIVYEPLSLFAGRQMAEGPMPALGFGIQVVGRTLAWTIAGMAMGLGQGVALRSRRLLLFGFIGGAVGGLLGGALFDPIDMFLLAGEHTSAHWSRLVGFAIIGGSAGVMIGVVELLARDAWLRMTEGPLAGKEFLVFKDLMRIGSSTQSDIYLFSDPLVSEHHATLRSVGEECELENQSRRHPALVNGRPVERVRLNHGDQITIGRTSFVFQRRRT